MKAFDEGYYIGRVNTLPFTSSMGMRLLSTRDGTSVMECSCRTDLINGSGVLHGGVMGSLVEMSITTALRSRISPSTQFMTIEHSISFLEPVREGKVMAHAAILRLGKTIAVGTAEIRNVKGEVIAFGSATISLKKQKVTDKPSRFVGYIP